MTGIGLIFLALVLWDIAPDALAAYRERTEALRARK